MAEFSNKSLTQLYTCDDRLVRVFQEVIKIYDCSILEGRRTWARQAELLREDPPMTTLEPGQSKHNPPQNRQNDPTWKSKATDAVPYPVHWDDAKRFIYFAGLVVATGAAQGVTIRWGGNWDMDSTIIDDQNFDDLPHFEIVD